MAIVEVKMQNVSRVSARHRESAVVKSIEQVQKTAVDMLQSLERKLEPWHAKYGLPNCFLLGRLHYQKYIQRKDPVSPLKPATEYIFNLAEYGLPLACLLDDLERFFDKLDEEKLDDYLCYVRQSYLFDEFKQIRCQIKNLNQLAQEDNYQNISGENVLFFFKNIKKGSNEECARKMADKIANLKLNEAVLVPFSFCIQLLFAQLGHQVMFLFKKKASDCLHLRFIDTNGVVSVKNGEYYCRFKKEAEDDSPHNHKPTLKKLFCGTERAKAVVVRSYFLRPEDVGQDFWLGLIHGAQTWYTPRKKTNIEQTVAISLKLDQYLLGFHNAELAERYYFDQLVENESKNWSVQQSNTCVKAALFRGLQLLAERQSEKYLEAFWHFKFLYYHAKLLEAKFDSTGQQRTDLGMDIMRASQSKRLVSHHLIRNLEKFLLTDEAPFLEYITDFSSFNAVFGAYLEEVDGNGGSLIACKTLDLYKFTDASEEKEKYLWRHMKSILKKSQSVSELERFRDTISFVNVVDRPGYEDFQMHLNARIAELT